MILVGSFLIGDHTRDLISAFRRGERGNGHFSRKSGAIPSIREKKPTNKQRNCRFFTWAIQKRRRHKTNGALVTSGDRLPKGTLQIIHEHLDLASGASINRRQVPGIDSDSGSASAFELL